MKVTKQEAQGTKSKIHNHVAEKKFKNISARKTGSNEGAVSAPSCHQRKGTELSKIKHVDELNTVPPGHRQDSVNLSTETPVLLSGDGILRQVFSALVLFKHKNRPFFTMAYLTFRKYCVLRVLIFSSVIYTKSIFYLCFLRTEHTE